MPASVGLAGSHRVQLIASYSFKRKLRKLRGDYLPVLPVKSRLMAIPRLIEKPKYGMRTPASLAGG
jgi:hypothetical protein